MNDFDYNNGNNNGQNQNGYNGYNGWQPMGQFDNKPTAPPQANANGEYSWNFADYGGGAKPKKRSAAKVVFSILGGFLSVAVVGFAVYGVVALIGNADISSPPAVTDSAENDNNGTAEQEDASGLKISDVPDTTANDSVSLNGELSTQQIYQKVNPSVVGIVSYVQSGGWNSSSQGSGIIMSSDGYIITNAHVIKSTQGVKAVLSNGEEYEATVIGSDSKTDLAVLKIEADNLTPAEFGNSNQTVVGEKVVAIGNPGGLEFAGSISQGIVSAVNRPLKSSTGITMECIQTDAAINPGNSGGALVNEFGQVIGINSAKIAATDYEGIGFAIPISTAKPIIDDLIENGMVTGRAKIGVTIDVISEMQSKINAIPTGVCIVTIEEGSDIANKGVLPYDIITHVDGEKVDSASQLYDILNERKPGDELRLTIFRRPTNAPDQTFDVTIVLGEDKG